MIVRNGLLGGLIGELMYDRWERLYGQRGAGLRFGIISVVFGLFLLIFIPLVVPKDASTYVTKRLTYDNSFLATDRHGDDGLVLMSGERYWLSADLWRDRFADSTVVALFREQTTADVWLEDEESTTIRGIRARGIEIDRSVGAEHHRATSRWGITLVVALVMIAWGGWSIWAGTRRRLAAGERPDLIDRVSGEGFTPKSAIRRAFRTLRRSRGDARQASEERSR